MSEKRFEALEMQMVFQEDVIQKLDDALIAQQKQIHDLQVQMRHLSSQVELAENQMPDDGPEPPPPHY